MTQWYPVLCHCQLGQDIPTNTTTIYTLGRRGDDQEHLEDEDDEGLGAVEGGEVEEEVVDDAEVRRDQQRDGVQNQLRERGVCVDGKRRARERGWGEGRKQRETERKKKEEG